ncbi:uncharacterized protein [Cicer arietinum]|uniref:Uncharacterized protein LOC113785848 isoform X2 n=1 Tax=Cicer arietinum TaxID=3827 RepID=A0A3Q7Y9I7_CICAR|nr:uncharacterized protein LOC113785848 isoform X2 [Cicer arietinum]
MPQIEPSRLDFDVATSSQIRRPHPPPHNNNVADSVPKENRPPPHNGVEAPKKCRSHPRHTVNYANVVGLNHNPGISLDWTVQEQLALQKALVKFASSYCGTTLYAKIVKKIPTLFAKIAKKIPTKTIRDIVLRLKWMHENVVHISMQSLDSADQPNILSIHPPEDVRMDNDDGISFKAIDDTTGVQSEKIQQALDLVESNLASLDNPNLKYDNMDLYLQIKNNFNEVLNDANITKNTTFSC